MNRRARRVEAANRRLREAMALQRTCGQCRECCTTMPVDLSGVPGSGENVKAAGMPCEHLRDAPLRGCGIYETRPEGCRSWRCMWLVEPDTLSGDERPDRLGVILDCKRTALDMTVILARETTPGAARSGPAWATIHRLAQRNLVMIVSGDTRRGTFVEHERFGPPELLERWSERVTAWELGQEAERARKQAEQVTKGATP